MQALVHWPPAAVLGAQLNVRINAAGLKDRVSALNLQQQADEIARYAIDKEQEILSVVTKIIEK